MRLGLITLLTFFVAGYMGFGPGLGGNSMDWYDDAWAKVESFDQQGLPKSALEVVETIYSRALSEHNDPQLIRSLLFRSRYRLTLEEDVADKVFGDLVENLEHVSAPSRAVLHSVIGELYWQYFQANRYQFYNRTSGGAPDDASIETWDQRKIVSAALAHYRQSLEPRSALVAADVRDYLPIVNLGTDSRNDRPTLFDLLAHRALDVLEHGESSLTSPVDPFRLDSGRDLAPASVFVATPIVTDDSLSMQAEVLGIYKNLLRIHEQDARPNAYVHSDLRRLRYVRSQLSSNTVLEKYIGALVELAERLRDDAVYAEIRHAHAQALVERANQYDPMASDQYKWDRKEAVAVCEEAVTRHRASRGANYCQSLVVNERQRNLAVSVRGVVIPGDETFARVVYRNVDKIYLKIVAISEDEARNWQYSNARDQERLTSLAQLRNSTYESAIELPDDGDLQEHSTLVAIPALPQGQYIILAASSPNFSLEGNVRFSGVVTSSNLSYIERRQPSGGNRLYVLDRVSGHPIAGASVTGYLRDNNGRALPANDSRLITDADGMVEFTSVDARYDNIELRYEGDWMFSTNGLYSNRGVNRTRTYSETRFFTDRAIYRPGQTIYFKGILLERENDRYRIRPDQKTRVVFRDVNGREIGVLDRTSNEYGTIAGSFVAPRGVLTGSMTIADGYGQVSISVEEYKRPRFEVEFDAVADAVSLGDSITVHGKATSLAGAAIGDGVVQYRVTRSTYFPWWGYRSWRPWPQVSDAEIAFGTTRSNPDGSFSFSFVAEEDSSLANSTRPSYRYTVTADVTDIAGETRTATTSVSASRESVFLSLNVPDEVDASTTIKFDAGANNINGQPLSFDGRLTVTRLEKPGLLLPNLLGNVDTLAMSRSAFKKIAPHTGYLDEEDPATWKRGRVVFEQEVSGSGIESVSTDGPVRWEPGSYEVRFTAQNDDTEEVEVIRYVTVFSSRSGDGPDETLDWFTLLTPTVEPGQDARYIIGSSQRNVRMLVEIEQNGVVLRSEWVRISDQQKNRSFPVLESHRGNLALHVTFAWENHVFTQTKIITVPWTNKQLSLNWETFRSKLYPGQDETWKLKISGPQGEAVASELVATLYDASLDALRPHNWSLDLWPTYGAQLHWNTNEFNRPVYFRRDGREWNSRVSPQGVSYDQLNLFGFGWYYGWRGGRGGRVLYKSAGAPSMAMQESVVLDSPVRPEGLATSKDDVQAPSESVTPEAEPQAPATVRTNLNETAFFMPQLETDADGNTILSFSMPEALTRWRFMGIAITDDLKIGALQDQTVTQKELMVTPNSPRFFRDGDTIVFTAKVDNLTENDLSGSAELELENATTGEILTTTLGVRNQQQPISIKAGQSTPLEWTLSIPTGISAITYRVKARTDQFADGEEAIVPVLTNRMLVTESLPLPMRGPGTKEFRFDKLADHTSSTLVNERFTLEYSPNPIWYAVQSLPYLMEFPHECAEQVFSRFYANGIATHIVGQQPRLRTVYDSWKAADASALVSNLEKNQELKAIMLEEAPWVMAAANETERKRRIGILFDTFRMRGELVGAITKLEQLQHANGAWPWFDGMRDDRYITQHIVKGIGYLRRIGVLESIDDGRPMDLARRAIGYLDSQLMEDYQRLIENKVDLKDYRPGVLQLHHLYARSFFPEEGMSDEYKKVHEYFVAQSRKFWLEYSYVGQGMISIEAHRAGASSIATAIVNSLREKSIDNEELGMYWKMDNGYFWYQAPIETQALLIEVFNEVADDKESVSAMQLWLLKQKQTQDWKTTKATADAIYALLMRGTNLLDVDATVSVRVGNEVVSSATEQSEEGTGYFKKAWSAEAVNASMANITVTKTGDGPAWGAAYWQYFEDLDRITPAETPLKLEKELYLQRQTAAGPTLVRLDADTKLVPGDLVKVRVVVKVDRAMEYVHLKDMRSSGFEPVNVLSGFKWQDGLGYYESTRDAATHFFISYLPKGTFVFEYPVRVSHRGDFSNGITSIQSMYAPEFTSHSAGIRVKVGE